MLNFLLFCLLAAVGAQDYCSVSTDHTMCRFGDEPGRACGKRSKGGLDRGEIEEILRVHNELRANVASGYEKRGASGSQPPAANMYSLVWDDGLAEVAQRWADQCTFQHDKCRDDPRFPVGQNIYWSSGVNGSNWSRAVRLWYREVSDMRPHLVRSYAYEQHTAHYTQLAWARTRYVGCGRRGYGGSYRPRGGIALEHLLAEARNGTFPLDEGNLDATLGAESRKEESKATEAKRKHKLISDNFIKIHMNKELRPLMPKLAEKMRNWYFTDSTKHFPIYSYGRYTRPFSSDIFSDRDSSDYNLSEYSESNSSEDIDENDRRPVTVVSPDTMELITWTSEGWKIMNYDWNEDQILVCNYGPSGNVIGQPVYEVGPPCSKCPADSVCREGLCA